MQISHTLKPPSPISVTAFIDGKAKMIEPPVLRGHDKFERVAQTGRIDYRATGQRRAASTELLQGTGFLAGSGAIAALGAAVAAQFGTEVGLCVGLFALPPAIIGARRIQTALTTRDFQPGEPVTGKALSERFGSNLAQAKKTNPSATQVAYISGHGSHQEIGHMTPEQIGDVLLQNPVELTVLDACKTAQMEVLSKLGTGAGQILCSTHEVPARGFPIKEMFTSAEILGSNAFESAKDSTAHLSLVNNPKFIKQVLPALDNLAQNLNSEPTKKTREKIHRALKASRNPDLFGPRVGLRAFLDNLGKQELAPHTKVALDKTVTGLKEAIPLDTGWAVTVRVDGEESEALPPAWNQLFQELDYKWKPFF